jgi:hypothetical protein
MTRAEELAAELERATGDIHAELETIPDERWQKAITGPEGWPVGHAAHHIGEGYLLNLSWIDRATADGRPVVLDPAVDIPAMNVTNARCLEEHGNQPRPVTMDFLRASARTLIDRVAQLTDEQLDGPMMVIMGEDRTGSLVALPLPLRHANNHLQSIRDASIRG